MISFAFIMGVVPLVISQGAGAEMRHAMGISVFFGMLGVTLFGLFLTPVFYLVIRKFSGHSLHAALHRDEPDDAPFGYCQPVSFWRKTPKPEHIRYPTEDALRSTVLAKNSGQLLGHPFEFV